jgi:uncharacterized glyoxalase superfamily protein PhnB
MSAESVALIRKWAECLAVWLPTDEERLTDDEPAELTVSDPLAARHVEFFHDRLVQLEALCLARRLIVSRMLDSEVIIRTFLPDWSRQNGNQISIAVECASLSEVDEIYARVTSAGFEGEKEPWDAYWGQRYALLGDPDGVRVNLYAPLETG